MGVNIEQDSKKFKRPKIDDETSIKGMGPNPDSNYLSATNRERTPVIAVILGPGLYRAAAHISFLKALERKNIKVRMITGHGFSSLIAALYAKGVTPELIEWKFYKFMSKAKDMKPYTEEWKKLIKDSFLEKYRDSLIENSNIKLLVPIYSPSRKKVVYLNRGKLYDNLLSNIEINPGRLRKSSAFQWEIFNRNEHIRQGADIIIGSDLLMKGIDIMNANDFLFGVFSRVAGQMEEEKKNVDAFFSLPANNMKLDSFAELQDTMKDSYKYATDNFEMVYEQITKWQKEKNEKNRN